MGPGPGPKELELFVSSVCCCSSSHLRRGPARDALLEHLQIVLFCFFLLDLHCMHTCLVCMAASRSTNVQCWSLGLKNGDAVTVAAPYCFGMNDSLSMGNFEYTCPKNNLPCTLETARR